MRRICTFDIYGTLFDMGAVRRVLDNVVPDPDAFYRLWRFKLVHYLMIASAIGRFTPLTTLREKAFDFCSQELMVDANGETKQMFIEASLYLEPFSDVREGLERLRDGGFEVVAFSTGTKYDLVTMFENAGLDDLFHDVISCEGARIYKPHARAYLYAAEQLHAVPSEITMVAAHPWDLIGARNAGFGQAWLRRTTFSGLESRTYDTIDPAPDLVADTLPALADKIIAARTS